VFSRYGLSAADFQVVVNLRRAGSPYRLPQARLMKALTLTSGTVSVRVERLVKLGIVTREPDLADARGQLVQLTSRGLQLFDDIAPVHLANEDRLLSALGPADRRHLADLLRRLLAAYEDPVIDLSEPLGLWLEPAHLARARRVAVGLPDVPGLLVAGVTPGGPAAEAGVSRGDLLVTAGGVPARSEADVRAALASAARRTALQLRFLRGETELLVGLSTVR
jgi:DNA-binding MarR family transcriptional regulator